MPRLGEVGGSSVTAGPPGPMGFPGVVGPIGPTGAAGPSGFASGTSFPGSPATNDAFFRTDRGLYYYYDGTRWLTVTLYREPNPFGPITPQSASDAFWWPVWDNDYDIYVTSCDVVFFSSSLSGSAYWTAALKPRKADNTDGTQLGSTVNIQSAANATWLRRPITGINTVIDRTTYLLLHLDITKVGSPGPCYLLTAIRYRLVG